MSHTKVVNTSHHLTCFFGEEGSVRTFKFYFLGKFQLYNTVLPMIITLLYLTSSDLTHLVTESLYPFTNLFLFPSPSSIWQPMESSLKFLKNFNIHQLHDLVIQLLGFYSQEMKHMSIQRFIYIC